MYSGTFRNFEAVKAGGHMNLQNKWAVCGTKSEILLILICRFLGTNVVLYAPFSPFLNVIVFKWMRGCTL
jgi:hypothetical protein